MQRHFVIVFVDPRFAKAKNSDVIIDRLIEHRLHRLKMNKFNIYTINFAFLPYNLHPCIDF